MRPPTAPLLTAAAAVLVAVAALGPAREPRRAQDDPPSGDPPLGAVLSTGDRRRPGRRSACARGRPGAAGRRLASTSPIPRPWPPRFLAAAHSAGTDDAGRTHLRAAGYAVPGSPPAAVGVVVLDPAARRGPVRTATVTALDLVAADAGDRRRGYRAESRRPPARPAARSRSRWSITATSCCPASPTAAGSSPPTPPTSPRGRTDAPGARMTIALDELERLLKGTSPRERRRRRAPRAGAGGHARTGAPADPGQATTSRCSRSRPRPQPTAEPTRRAVGAGRAHPRTGRRPTAPPPPRRSAGAPRPAPRTSTAAPGGWQLYDGPGHDGKGTALPGGGRRSATASSRSPATRPAPPAAWRGARAASTAGGRAGCGPRRPTRPTTRDAPVARRENFAGGRRDRLHGDGRPHPAHDRRVRPLRRGQPPGPRRGGRPTPPSGTTGPSSGPRRRSRPTSTASEWFRTTDTAVQPPGPMHLCHPARLVPEGRRGAAVEDAGRLGARVRRGRPPPPVAETRFSVWVQPGSLSLGQVSDLHEVTPPRTAARPRPDAAASCSSSSPAW